MSIHISLNGAVQYPGECKKFAAVDLWQITGHELLIKD